jgi:hypothetical protein
MKMQDDICMEKRDGEEPFLPRSQLKLKLSHSYLSLPDEFPRGLENAVHCGKRVKCRVHPRMDRKLAAR